jgi:hypothetical protein
MAPPWEPQISYHFTNITVFVEAVPWDFVNGCISAKLHGVIFQNNVISVFAFTVYNITETEHNSKASLIWPRSRNYGPHCCMPDTGQVASTDLRHWTVSGHYAQLLWHTTVQYITMRGTRLRRQVHLWRSWSEMREQLHNSTGLSISWETNSYSAT